MRIGRREVPLQMKNYGKHNPPGEVRILLLLSLNYGLDVDLMHTWRVTALGSNLKLQTEAVWSSNIFRIPRLWNQIVILSTRYLAMELGHWVYKYLGQLTRWYCNFSRSASKAIMLLYFNYRWLSYKFSKHLRLKKTHDLLFHLEGLFLCFGLSPCDPPAPSTLFILSYTKC